jgi:hypothetical protein
MLYIHTSKIANILGYNKYITQEKYIEIFIDYLYKYKDELKELDKQETNIEILNSEEKYNNLINQVINDSTTENKESIKNILNNDITNTNNLIVSTNNINSLIDELDYNNLEKSKIKKEIQRTINCNYGTNTENNGIKRYEELTSLKVYNNNAELYTLDMLFYKICGKIDGLCKKDNIEYIFEIKNRKNKIFNEIPLYETVQLLIYTKLLNNNNIIFVQNMDDNMKIEYLKNYNNSLLLNEILNKLNKYVTLIYNLQKSNELRQLFLKKNKRQKYKYIIEFINN